MSVFVLLLLCCFSLVACGTESGDVLAYQAGAQIHTVAYEVGGTSIEATLSLGAGGAERDLSLTILSPPEAAGMTFTRTAGNLSVSEGNLSLPVSGADTVLLPLSLFCIPQNTTVSSVEKETGGTRLVTLTHGDCTWVLTMGAGDVPSRIVYTAGSRSFSMTILPHKSGDT